MIRAQLLREWYEKEYQHSDSGTVAPFMLETKYRTDLLRHGRDGSRGGAACATLLVSQNASLIIGIFLLY